MLVKVYELNAAAAEAGKISGHFFHKEPNGVTALTVVTSDSEIKKSPTAVTMMTSATAAMMPNQAQQQVHFNATFIYHL